MGFRFQKRISILPGVRINLSKTGVSGSLGGHGATVNMGLDGKPHVTFGVPGTGMSYKMALGPGLIIVGILLNHARYRQRRNHKSHAAQLSDGALC